ncbi:unnamed protein product [Phytophthora fragariaefolia]|uniref:Unnamed protein product n=1 Tax=Phytophthora fragariaefolia TaxID=1490495 RepID=A0A9W6UB35_9STRA|nr:unnamed protein product [Phytophthora fragariaefolia]
MEFERGAENLPVDSNMSTGSPNAAATHVAREDCSHLAGPEWEAFQRLATIIGEAVVTTMLHTLSQTEQHGVALGFIMKEQREVAARATVSAPSSPRVKSLKLHVNSYVESEDEPMLACQSRHCHHAYGRRLTDPTCFSTNEVFKEELRQAFGPLQNEFRSRAEFLDLQQGKHDVPAYAQRARYLVSNIMTALNNFVRLQSDASLDFDEFVDELIVLDLDDRFNMMLGRPWLARHDPVLDWAKCTIVRFRGSGATESDDPVGASHAPRGACDPPAEAARGAAASDLSARKVTTERVVREKCEPNQRTQTRSDLRGSRSVKRDAVVSTTVDTQVDQEGLVPEGSELGASAPVADAIGSNINGRSVIRRRGKRGASAPRADAASSADGCKRPAPEMLACSRAAGLHDEAVHNMAGIYCVGPKVGPAGDQKKDVSTAGPGQDKTRETGFRTRSERHKQAKLRKARSGTETLQAVSAGQPQQMETTVETLSVLTRTDTGLQYRKMALECPPTLASELTPLPAMSWKRFARDLHDRRFEQVCILSDVERMKGEAEELKQLVTEGSDALSAKSKKNSTTSRAGTHSSRALSTRSCASTRMRSTTSSKVVVKLAKCGNPSPRTPSGMVWGWRGTPQRLQNASTTFNRCVTHLLRSLCDFEPSYFDFMFVHSRAVNGKSDVEIPKEHLRKLFVLMCKHKLYANLKKCIIGTSEIPVIGCLLKPVERNYSMHDMVLLAMKYALAKFRVYLLGSRPFVVYTDHASLRTAIKSPHISHRMARWLSFFAEYNFQVKYKPGRLNVVVDALSHRPDYAVHKADANAIGVVRTSTPSSSLLDDVRSAYAKDADAKQLLNYFAAPSDKSRQKLAKHLRARVHRYRVHNGLLLYSTIDDIADRVVPPDDREPKLRITYEYHDALTSGHPGREKTYLLLIRDFYWNHQYKWVRNSKAMDFVQRRQAVIRFVQDTIAASVDRQKLNADNNGRGNTSEFKVGSLVLLATHNLTKHAVPDFTVLAKYGNAYTLDIPSSMRFHPTFLRWVAEPMLARRVAYSW